MIRVRFLTALFVERLPKNDAGSAKRSTVPMLAFDSILSRKRPFTDTVPSGLSKKGLEEPQIWMQGIQIATPME